MEEWSASGDNHQHIMGHTDTTPPLPSTVASELPSKVPLPVSGTSLSAEVPHVSNGYPQARFPGTHRLPPAPQERLQNKRVVKKRAGLPPTVSLPRRSPSPRHRSRHGHHAVPQQDLHRELPPEPVDSLRPPPLVRPLSHPTPDSRAPAKQTTQRTLHAIPIPRPKHRPWDSPSRLCSAQLSSI